MTFTTYRLVTALMFSPKDKARFNVRGNLAYRILQDDHFLQE
jgi:hypothetical protein